MIPNKEMMDYLLLVTERAQAYVRERESPVPDLSLLVTRYRELKEAVGLAPVEEGKCV